MIPAVPGSDQRRCVIGMAAIFILCALCCASSSALSIPAPTGCVTGTVGSVVDNGTTTTWMCNGSGGGTSTGCSDVDPACVSTGCAAASTVACGLPIPNDNCGGACLGTGTSGCVVPVAGVCGLAGGAPTSTAPSSGLCQNGATPPVTVSGTNWIWTCPGTNGGAPAP